MKQIMLVNDMPGYGKVALAAMVPVLSRMGHYIFQLPTAMISNTLDFGKFRIQDMTEYMQDTLAVWEQLGFVPDCICTGFLVSAEQAEFLCSYIQKQKNTHNCLIVVDPIMGDGGSLYNGVVPERVDIMRRLVQISDLMVPNITEACFLTGRLIADGKGREEGTRGEIRGLIDGLRAISGKSVVITSVVEAETGAHLVCGYDHKEDRYFEVPYEYLPVRIAGSGDIFSAILTGSLLAGIDLEGGVKKAVAILHDLIIRNNGKWEAYKGILVEQYWDVFEKYGI